MTPPRFDHYVCSGGIVVTDEDSLDDAQASGRWIKSPDYVEADR